MHNRRLLIAVSAAVWCAARGAPGQVNLWPAQLVAAADSAPEPGSGFEAGAMQSLYITTLKSLDTLRWVRNDSSVYIEQDALTGIHGDGKLRTWNEYSNFAGKAMLKNVVKDSVSAGLYWAPDIVYNVAGEKRGIQGSADLGPVVNARAWQVPLEVRGGFSAIGWSDSLVSLVPDRDERRRYHSDYGAFAGIEIGNWWEPWRGAPFYAQLQAYGRGMQSSVKLHGMGSALYMRDIGTGDSVFAFITDTVVSGNEAVLEGGARYVNIPERINRSMKLMAGVRAGERAGFRPAAVYSYTDQSAEYPSDTTFKDDRRHVVHGISMLTDLDLKIIGYSGGIRFEWHDEDKLFRDRVEGPPFTAHDSVVLSANVNDYSGYEPHTTHVLSKYLENGAGVEYTFDISRNAKTYPDSFGAIGAHYNDNDQIELQHDVKVSMPEAGGWTAQLLGTYSVNSIVYLKDHKSGGNKGDRFYLAGVRLGYARGEVFSVKEALNAEAAVTGYHFPDANLSVPPPRSRRVWSELYGEWRPRPFLECSAKWLEEYSDFGYWSSLAYQRYEREMAGDTTAPQREFYAIRSKTFMHEVLLSVKAELPWGMRAGAGTVLGDVFGRTFDGESGTYVVQQIDEGYRVEPFIAVAGLLRGRIGLNARLKTDLRVAREGNGKISIGETRAIDAMLAVHFVY
jgi:hypothetical protein